MSQHPITPPPELIAKWASSMCGHHEAARWGADQQLKLDAEQINQAWQDGADAELKACCEWLEDADLDDSQKVSWVNLRAARRPKPPSLKEQALAKIDAILSDPGKSTLSAELEALELSRRALEQLPDEEMQP